MTGGRGTGPLAVMIKPVSGACDMRCRYCFYADEMSKRGRASCGRMDRGTLRSVLKNALASSRGEFTAAFQGGEPTLAGVGFYREAVAAAREFNGNGCRIHWAIQTNGLAIDREWCDFFRENGFLVGLSLDGPEDIHDGNRIDGRGRGTFERVMAAARLMRKTGVEFNILSVVTGRAAEDFGRVWDFFDRNGFVYRQFIPCLDPFGEERGGRPWSLTAEGMERYLKTAFDGWYGSIMAGRPVYHRYFDGLLFLMDGRPPEACGMAGRCGLQYVVEADGSVYPCDFYAMDGYCLGNLARDSVETVDRRREELGFISRSEKTEDTCRVCRWRSLCRGGCRRDRDYFEKGLGLNCYCGAYRAFFEYAWPRLRRVYEFAKRFSGR